MSWNNKEETVITGCRKLGKCTDGVSSHGIMFIPISGETGSMVQELKWGDTDGMVISYNYLSFFLTFKCLCWHLTMVYKK
jgi:hypothetical protein